MLSSIGMQTNLFKGDNEKAKKMEVAKDEFKSSVIHVLSKQCQAGYKSMELTELIYSTDTDLPYPARLTIIQMVLKSDPSNRVISQSDKRKITSTLLRYCNRINKNCLKGVRP